MSKNKQIGKEEEIRNRIRQELEKAYASAQQRSSSKLSQHSVDEDVNIQLDLIKKYIKKQIEEEFYSSHPEFIKCENYLGETRWLTLLELEEDHEFFTIEESKFRRLVKKFKKTPKSEWIDSPAYDDLKKELKQSIESDARVRADKFHEAVKKREGEEAAFSSSKIHQEEMDRFYSSKSDYKKYRNHISEEKWMMKKEFDNQEEFFEEIVSLKRRIIKWFLLALAGMATCAALWVIIQNLNHPQVLKGFVIIEIPESHGNLYIDQKLAVGFRPNQPLQLLAGKHELAVFGPGFVSDPKSKSIIIVEGDTVTVRFRLIEKKAIEGALVVITAPYPDASIFVNGEFNGPLAERSSLVLPGGAYNIILEKEGYVTNPAQHALKVSVGDTVNIAFDMTPELRGRSRRTDNQLTKVGLIEVRSDIKNADIYLDGKLTDYKTDYVLQKVPYGRHVVRVSKSGYHVSPDDHVVDLDKLQKREVIDFILSSTSRKIKIQTRPVDGTILIDGKKVGYGSFKGRVMLGKHEIIFGDVEYYSNPGKQQIDITKDSPEELVFTYKSDFRLEFTPDGLYPAHTSAHADRGYILEGKNFKRGEDAGPEIRKAGIFESVWWMGYAFEYRNPRGVDALMFTFSIPDNIDLSLPVYLKVYGYRTDSAYPLVISGKSIYRIIINNTGFRNQVRPSIALENANQGKYDQFTINHLLRKGYNRIIISTTDDASAFLALWKVVIE